MNWKLLKDLGSLLGSVFSALSSMAYLLNAILDFLKKGDE